MAIAERRARFHYGAVWMRLLTRWLTRSVEALAVPLLLVASVLLVYVVIKRSIDWTHLASHIPSHKDRITAENEIFRTLAQILGGGFVLAGLYFTARSVTISRQAAVTDRLSKALEALGADRLNERVGAVNSLAALSRVSSHDYQTIVRTLCAFIRHETSSDSYRADNPASRGPREDVRAALEALGGRPRSYRIGERARLDLRKVFLDGADLRFLDFAGADFKGASLINATLFRVLLRSADLQDVDLSGASLNQADLRDASFYNATMTEAAVRRAVLQRTRFARARLNNSSFDDSELVEVIFSGAQMQGTSFSGSVLRKCNFARVPLDTLDLSTAHAVIEPRALGR